jgi:hypothetical protein
MSKRHLSCPNIISVFAYRVFAEGSNEPIYEALCTSTKLNNDGKWLHLPYRHTPLSWTRELPFADPNGLQSLG